MIRIICSKPYLDQVKDLIVEYTNWLGRDLSFQNLDQELADIAEKYTASNIVKYNNC
ncbi:MAG: hypothetical protein SPG03_07555 [Veillonella caviae]|uniref:hypothetical protein n=1 Tax=Veillonella caviae TaxID=248316 RepID=UPI002A7F17A9|nr:hypothetical protein [Veillonella caviae]MDY4745703.1 hypothetical protein [Veillonella caviae]MDY5482224.1 hypothetical protein [Veillonella caviae]